MQRLTARQNVSRAAVIIPLAAKTSPLYHARLAMISRMSGYPSALHSIGRLQRCIKLDSFENLLTSLHKVYNIAYTTAEVIESMDGTNMKNYQLNRTEIVAYVSNITTSLKNFTATEEDLDIIAHLITSFEANPASWTLSGGTSGDNLHGMFKQLYKEVLTGSDDYRLSIYASHDDSILPFRELPYIQELMKSPETATAKKKKKGEQEAEGQPINPEVDALYTQYRFSATRMVDHVYHLMMDRDVWYHFVAPRTRTDVTTNLERARSLKLFALYIQSLLTYYQFFNLEMFMQSYDLVQKWIAHFPPLETETVNKLEKTIRPHDFLGAKDDVASLIRSFTKSAEEDLKALVMPSEFLGSYGVTKAVADLTDKAGDFSLSGDLSNLKELDNPKFLPLTSGVAVSKFDIVYQLADVLLVKKLVSRQVETALVGLVPAITRGSAKASIDALRALNIQCKIPFEIPHAASWKIEAGVHQSIQNGVLRLDSASPMFSYDYHQFIRDSYKFRLTTDRQIALAYNRFTVRQVVDYDKANHLRSIMSYNWRSLVPSYWRTGDRTMRQDYFIANPDNARYLIESMSGMSYEIAIREMALPHVREIWATFLSSFALMYYREGDLTDLRTANMQRRPVDGLASIKLVEGHGQPYGTSYSSLETMQGPLTDETEMVSLGFGVYLRFLHTIPVVTDELVADAKPFYSHTPILYFSSNSIREEVKEWVFDDGLLNFALVPVSSSQFVPEVKFTPKYAFLNQSLFLNMDMHYRPAVPDNAREVVDVSLISSDWPYERHQYFLDYRHFGPYTSPAAASSASDEQLLVADAIKEIEQTIKQDEKQAAQSAQQAGEATRAAAEKASEEVDQTTIEAQKRIENLDSGDATVIPG